MTVPRKRLYVWVTWLSRLMAGESNCHWAPWFKTHFTKYPRTPSEFQLAAWMIKHTQLLDKVVKERVSVGETIYKENQNSFRVKRQSGLTIAGRPDLVTVDAMGHFTVFDTKTGNPKQSDIIQVMLYMLFLPYTKKIKNNSIFNGCVVYRRNPRVEIPADFVTESFKEYVIYFLNILESSEPPERTPSPSECRFCDITSVDCVERKVCLEMDVMQAMNYRG